MKILRKGAMQRMHHIRHNRADDRIFDIRRFDLILLQKVVENHAVLIGRTWHLGRDTESRHNLITFKYTTCYIGIAYIYRKYHILILLVEAFSKIYNFIEHLQCLE